MILISLIVLLLGGAVVFGLWFQNNYRRKMSLAQLQKKDPQYTGLIYASLSNGGGMNGERYLTSIGYDENKKIIYTTEESPEHYVPALVTVYEVEDSNAMKELDEYVGKYNMSVWDKIPLSDMQVLDAPSTSLNLQFKASEDQKYTDYMTISYERDLSDECFEVLRNFTRKMSSYPKRQIDRYFSNYNEDNIYIGKDIENDDEQIKTVLNGYFYNDENRSIYADAYEGNLRIRGIYSEDFVDYDIEEAQIVHEQFKDYDCSWYVRYGTEEEAFYVTASYEKLFIEDSQGNTYVLTRNL